MEKSSEEFKVVAPEYIHCKETSFSSGADVKTLDNIIYISLDTFKEKPDNGITTKLDSWLTFFTAEEPEDVIKLVSTHPDFLQMYRDISEFRKSPEEVIGMFSEALRIMDRNTTKYMIDELHEQIESQSRTITDQNQTITDQNQTITDQSRIITAQDQTIFDLNQTVTELKKRIEELKECK